MALPSLPTRAPLQSQRRLRQAVSPEGRLWSRPPSQLLPSNCPGTQKQSLLWPQRTADLQLHSVCAQGACEEGKGGSGSNNFQPGPGLLTQFPHLGLRMYVPLWFSFPRQMYAHPIPCSGTEFLPPPFHLLKFSLPSDIRPPGSRGRFSHRASKDSQNNIQYSQQHLPPAAP